MHSGPTIRRSFGYDLFSLIGPEMVRASVTLSAFSDRELAWAQASLACQICAEAAAKAALHLRTFRERTGIPINRAIGDAQPNLYEAINALVHHRKIEILLDPPLQARPSSRDWIDIKTQPRHRLTAMIVESDKKQIEVSLADFASSIADEINHQLNSPEGQKIKKEKQWPSS